MFFRTPFILPKLYPDLVWRMPAEQNNIYVTFDDGPVPGPTEFVLEVLEKYKAKATFFCIGDNVRKHPTIFKKVIEKGHAIANHTHNHLKGWNFSVNDYKANVDQCEHEMKSNGFVMKDDLQKLFRPPYGRIKRSQIRSLVDYKIIMWDVLTADYSQSLSADNCLRGSIKAVRPGSIVVFHDSLKAEKNMNYALPRLLEHFSNLNYSFKSL